MATVALPPVRDAAVAVDEAELEQRVEVMRRLSAKLLSALGKSNAAFTSAAIEGIAESSSSFSTSSNSTVFPAIDLETDAQFSSSRSQALSRSPSSSTISSSDEQTESPSSVERTLVLPAAPLAATPIVPAAVATPDVDTVAEVATAAAVVDVAVETEEEQQPQARTGWRYYWDNWVAYWFDAKWALSIIDPREYIFPMTWRKAAHWTFYGSIAATIVLTEYFFGWMHFINPYNWAVIWLTFVLVLAEPFVVFLVTLFSRPYDRAESWRELGVSREEVWEKNKDVAVIVPCHKSEDVILPTLRALVEHVREEQIFMVHNANTKLPIDRSGEIARKVYPNINYVWSGIGSKTVAEYVGLKMAKKYKYVIVMDDDVILPDNFRMPVDLFKGKTKVVTFPIAAIPPEHLKPNWLTRSQDIEYKFAGSVKAFQSNAGSVLYPHGAIAMWDREALGRVLYEQHDCVFYAEDVKTGMGASRLGMQIKHFNGSYVPTEVPVTVVGGAQPNFYTQRIRSWEMGMHIYLGKFLYQFLFVWYRGDYWWQFFTGNLVRKMFEFYTLYNVFMDIFTIPLLIMGCMIVNLWIMLGIIIGINLVVLILWRLIALRKRPDANIRVWDIVVFTLVYRPVNIFMRLFGALRAYLIYRPNFQSKPLIPDYEKNAQLRANVDPVWLRPGFEEGTYDDDAYRTQLIANSGETVVDMIAPAAAAATVATATMASSSADDTTSFSSTTTMDIADEEAKPESTVSVPAA